MRRWFRNNLLNVLQYVLGLSIAAIILWTFIILYEEDNWVVISGLATLVLALAAFLTIAENRRMRSEDIKIRREEEKRERTERAADELGRWAEEALRLYYLGYNYHKDEIKNGLDVLTLKLMLMITVATIIGDEFIEPTKRAERALAAFSEIINNRYYNRGTRPVDEALLKEFEDAFYMLLSYLYVLRIWDYDYHRFLEDAMEHGALKSEYQLAKEGTYIRENQQS